MNSIAKVWSNFDHTTGRIDLNEFKNIMVKVALDHQLYEGKPEEVQMNTVFFTDDNLDNIFQQILEQEDNNNDGQITHTSVVDILYNVFNQIEQNKLERE